MAFYHSIETFGTVDGPGIRFVLFVQGCPLRCLYCHNPDTWDIGVGKQITVDEVVQKYNSCKEFLKNGGITVTGGEPLVQIDFVTELFAKFKSMGVHTCVDTSGITFNKDSKESREKFDKLMQVTDLVLLDIKHIDDTKHKELTGMSNKNVIHFANYLKEINKDVWIRHVIVPGYTLNNEYLRELGRFIGTLKNIKALDILPFHTMGSVKYKNLGIKNPLEGLQDVTADQAIEARNMVMEGIKDTLREEKNS